MRIALAAVFFSACAATSSPEEAVLFPGLADLPPIEGSARATCPFAMSPAAHIERVCLELGSGVDEDHAREWYQKRIINDLGWTRARSDERIADVWILPSDSEIICLTVSAYRTVEEARFVEFVLVRERLAEPSGVSACDG